MAVDTLGLAWALVITPASVQDPHGAQTVLVVLRQAVKRLKVIWVDPACRAVVDWAWCWVWEVFQKPKDLHTFRVLPKRWIVERTFGWLNRFRKSASLQSRRAVERGPGRDAPSLGQVLRFAGGRCGSAFRGLGLRAPEPTAQPAVPFSPVEPDPSQLSPDL